MQYVENPKRHVFVALIFTESTASVLNISLPHLEHLHPDDSKICVVTASEYSYLKKCRQQSKKTKDDNVTSTGSKQLEEIYLKLSSDVGLFTTSNYSSSSSVNDEELENFKSDRSSIFEVSKINKFPLLAARSMAHANKLDIQDRTIHVTLLETDSKSSTEFICRICHGGDSEDDLLTPCRCRGTVALVHLKCLERWLRESDHSTCELCNHRYKIIREPKYSVPWSILVFLRHPGDHWKDLIIDLFAFSVYTPSAIASTYMLMMICESLVKSKIISPGTLSSHIVAFSAVFGMAAIDFTYSSWLLMTLQTHIEAWRKWCRSNSNLKIILPKVKLRPHKSRNKKEKEKLKNTPVKCKSSQ
ncbi:unnamed protein product [Acanthoscelides obtectus]|uniref:RING-CH-type domain-containing protein n=1 Tax=Acanthoscelides obtectus TaxID=200917 RepID=A0A9P0LYB3_ACAOB|nr:unnamed protein product [Acanthoscelides obtectus]CAK1665076.1 E3 ubiquitin-protein ligase MARCH3 [Acanthoscelides obtectus]